MKKNSRAIKILGFITQMVFMMQIISINNNSNREN